MPKLLHLIFIILALCPLAASQDLYDVSVIHTVQITFPQSNWDHLLDSLYAIGEDRLLGSCTVDGVFYDSVGVRYKGFSTYSPSRVKNPFNIKLDYIIDDQEHQGYGTLKLANVWFDPSFLREVLGYEIARKYMAAGLAAYSNVYVNGTLMGLYVNVQDVDKLFCRTHFGSGGGARIKGEIEGPPMSWVVWGYEGEDSTAYMDTYELDSDEGWSSFIDFLDTLNNHTADVAQVFDVDRHLWMLAYDNLLVNLDAPINFGHNYYLYRDDALQFNPIIWDLNMNFGGFNSLIGGSSLTVAQMQQLTPFLNETNPNYPIVNKFLPNTTFRKQYIAHMKTIIAENFANGWYQTRGVELQNIIATAVQADPNKFSSYSSFLANLNSQVGPTPGITQLMNARATYLTNHSAFQAAGPTISVVTHSPAVVPFGGTVAITATVTNATSVLLAYRDNPVYPFAKTAMLDDGAHNDGAAGDGVFGISIAVANSDMHYYIYGENANAASFLPPRAEFEDSLITVIAPTGTGIVVNEFQADNATTITDQDGEYEDWIELYNSTAAPIALGGFHLSDKLDNFGKWTFPDTTIAAYGYLTIWADEDGTQVGLHANFKLSASGEAIVFSNPDLTVIDSLSFGVQVTDSSYSRCPNGTGPFGTTAPSYGITNTCPAGYTFVVVNEVQADNATTITDQDGEYEDWIELYNTSSSPVSLAGCYLSDKTDNVTKWALPDTTIAASGYLIIWADEDGAQVGLHANFKLSASGEAVVFTAPDTTVLQSVVFGAQTTDKSYSRCPNGTGTFSETDPSFAAANDCSTFLCGDADGSTAVSISDAVYLINYIFAGGPAPNPLLAGDADCSSAVSISDAVYLINYIFAGGPAPCAACP